MRLFHSPTSPYVRKIMVLLHETGRTGEVELVSATASPVDSSKAPVAQNPLGKVPALEREDGPALYDSRVITRYLDARFGAGLYPEPPRLWEMLTLEATGEGILDAALLLTYESRLRPEGLRWNAWADGQWEKIARACTALEARWMSHLGGKLDMGQIAVGCALGYLDLRHDARGWRAGHPGLADWYAAFSERPSMQATVPPA